MAGLKTHLNFPTLKNLGNILINRAELVLTQTSFYPGYDSSFPAPAEMLVIRSTESGANDFTIPDLTEGIDYYGGKKLSETNTGGNTLTRYRFNITRHLQAVENGYEDFGIYLLNTSSAVTADRIIIGSPKHSSAAIKLNLTYTLIDP